MVHNGMGYFTTWGLSIGRFWLIGRVKKMTSASWVHMHTTSQQIELGSPGCLGFEDLSISFP